MMPTNTALQLKCRCCDILVTAIPLSFQQTLLYFPNLIIIISFTLISTLPFNNFNSPISLHPHLSELTSSTQQSILNLLPQTTLIKSTSLLLDSIIIKLLHSITSPLIRRHLSNVFLHCANIFFNFLLFTTVPASFFLCPYY